MADPGKRRHVEMRVVLLDGVRVKPRGRRRIEHGQRKERWRYRWGVFTVPCGLCRFSNYRLPNVGPQKRMLISTDGATHTGLKTPLEQD